MRQSQLFTKTRKEAPKDEVAKNAEFLIRAGYVHKEMAGVYSYLPLGLKVLQNICNIIREEMNMLGGEEVFLSSLQNKEVWEKSGRWNDTVVDTWFKTELKNGTELGLGLTHEEPLTDLMKNHIRSGKDLPRLVYQIQTKFRNEIRAKSGLMRGREFLMKDLYSFAKDDAEHKEIYEQVKKAYKAIFEKVGLGELTYLTWASGGSFSTYSHEFQTLTSSGEDLIHICEKCHIAINDEIFVEQNTCPECGGTEFKKEKSVEVGNIFSLGTKYSSVLDLSYIDESGVKNFVTMGSYGIGPGRLMGTIVETHSDERGIIWPKSVSPFTLHLVYITSLDGAVKKECDELYQKFKKENISVLYDDRDLRAGEKFADGDLIGIPWRATVSEKTQTQEKIELKNRKTGEVHMVSFSELLKIIA